MAKNSKGVIALKPKADTLEEFKRVTKAMWLHLTGKEIVKTDDEWKTLYARAKKSPSPRIKK